MSEDRVLELQPNSQLREQQRLQQQNHSEAQNERARQECRALLQHGYGALADYAEWIEQQEPRSRVVPTNRPAPAAEDRSWADCWK